MTSLITFIIPTVGRPTLKRAIQSLLDQQDPGWNAIVVFDGIAPTLSEQDPRISVMQIPKTGVANHAGRVRNAGLALATTDWVGFVDDDDTLNPLYITHLKTHLQSYPNAEVVIFRMNYTCGRIIPRPQATNFQEGDVGISFCCRRDLHPRFEPSMVEDFRLLDHFRTSGKMIIMSPHVVYHVRPDLS